MPFWGTSGGQTSYLGDIYSKIATKMQRKLLLCDKLSNITQWKEFVFMKHLINFRTQTTHLGDKNGGQTDHFEKISPKLA